MRESLLTAELHVRDTMKIERGGQDLATVHKRIVGIRDRFQINVDGGG